MKITDSGDFLGTAWIFDGKLPKFGIFKVRMTDIRILYFKKSGNGRTDSTSKENKDRHGLKNGRFWPSLVHTRGVPRPKVPRTGKTKKVNLS